MPSSTATTVKVPSSFVLWTMRLLCATALLITGYLAITAFRAEQVIGCSGSALLDCNHVLNSRYSKIFEIPVSVPAFVLYASLLSVLCFFRRSAPAAILKAGWAVLGIGSLCAAGAAVWFVGLQFSEWKFCQFCLAAHSCGIVLAILVLIQTPLGWKQQAGFAATALAGVLGLIASQTLVEPPTKLIVERFDDVPVDTGDSPEAFGSPMEFGAPVEFGAPTEFAPPVFDAPGMEVSSVELTDGDREDPNREAPSHEEANSESANQETVAGLVPPPVDVVQTVEVATREHSSSQNDLTTADGGQLNPVPNDLDGNRKSVTESEATIVSNDEDSAVEFTPPMEVPVVFPDSSNRIQRVDFRETNGEESEATEPVDAESTGVAPATSDSTSTDSVLDQSGVKTATKPKADLQANRQPEQTGPRAKNSGRAFSYLFFSASGATNANLADLFLMAPGSVPVSQSDTADVKEEPAKDRMVVVRNQFSLNPKHWPLLGDPDAKYIFVEMFDYTCSHCRATNSAVKGAMKELDGDLAIIALPVPLERKCNPSVQGSGTYGACDMAKYGVAVWRLNRDKFADYHDYMCQQQRTASQAKAKAEALVGKDKLSAELAKPHAAEYIKRHVDLYQKVGSGSVPKLMFPKSTITGEINSTSILISRIKSELGE